MRYTVEGAEGEFSRKNFYLPCAINARLDDMTPEEKLRIYKATYWADNLTNGEWPVMMGHKRDGPVRSRMKKKVRGWFMILGRIAALNPGLYNEAVAEAKQMYLEQTGEPHPMFEIAAPVQSDEEAS